MCRDRGRASGLVIPASSALPDHRPRFTSSAIRRPIRTFDGQLLGKLADAALATKMRRQFYNEPAR